MSKQLVRPEDTVESLRQELEVTDFLLAEYKRVLNAIPECSVHGDDCVPHALEWIEKAKRLMEGQS